METWTIVVILVLIALCAVVGIVLARRGKKGAAAPAMSADKADALAAELLRAVGGGENVANVEHCATRLRFTLKRYAVDEAAAREAGALSVVRPAKTVCQIQVGPDAPQVYDALKKLL